MFSKSYLPLLAASALAISASAALAAGLLTAKNGMTLYVFDKDTGVKSTCYDKCAENWPPYLAEADAKKEKDWDMTKRKDGKLQWTYDGHPLYFFKGDVKAGDANGDGMNKIWHVVKE